MNAEENQQDPVTERIICCAFNVLNTLGTGFLEKVYENALAISLGKAAAEVIQQSPVSVFFEGAKVGDYFADLLVDGCVIVEIKVVKEIGQEHQAQLLNYLRATGLKRGLVLNFGTSRLGIKRMSL
jgi:GxxExxY protein